MKSLAILVFLLLAAPGSGRLIWDGIPFSSQVEFASLAVFVIAIFHARVRDTARRAISSARWQGALKPAIALLVVVKVLTFAWSPFGNGFDACYRSLYYPLDNPGACEKSYEGPFLRRSDLGLDNTTRTDRTVDFGATIHDWNLPFMNEFPRLSDAWLFRFPFSAQYGAVVKNSSKERMYLPILSIGKMSATVGNSRVEVDDYEIPQLSVLTLDPGKHDLGIVYEYRDIESTTPPEEAPVPRGPYASLKVGEPISASQLLDIAHVRVRGWAFDDVLKQVPDSVKARSAGSGSENRFELTKRPDVADYFKNPNLTASGFDFLVPLRQLSSGPLRILAEFDDSERLLGSIAIDVADPSTPPRVTITPAVGVATELRASVGANRSDFSAYSPPARGEPSLLLTSLLALLNLVTGVVLGWMLFILGRLHYRDVALAIGMAAAAFGLLRLGREAPTLFGSPTTLSLLLLSLLIVTVATFMKRHSLLTYLPTAAVLAHHAAFDLLNRFYLSPGEKWWGRLLYFSRDSDWYTIQGNARALFVTGSLQAGEAVFWFNAGPRYLAFVARVLLGENDILIALLMMTLAFFALVVLVVRFVSCDHNPARALVGVIVIAVVSWLFFDGVIAIFGLVGSSEYPTWIGLLAISSFIVVTKSESRTWLMVTMTVALAYFIQARHNQAFALALILLALIMLVDRTNSSRAVSTISIMIATFAVGSMLSLLHNLYYGESFVVFSGNASINEAFSWLDVLGINPGNATLQDVWNQLRTMMYWNEATNWRYAAAFWTSQALWIAVVLLRVRNSVIRRVESLFLLIPLGYALPMLKFQMDSYFPRHLVAINLSLMCAAMMAWPRASQNSPETSPEPVAQPAAAPA
ncbi:MAG: hypothetical protein ACKOXX_03480 [Actinomycetota bacterium]